MLQKVLKFANYAVEVLVEKNYAFLLQLCQKLCLHNPPRPRSEDINPLRELTDTELNCAHFFVSDLFSCSSSVRLLCVPNSLHVFTKNYAV